MTDELINSTWGHDVARDLAILNRRRYTPRPQLPIAHGTPGGYRAHLRRHEPACRQCLNAHATYNNRNRNNP